MNFSFHEQIKKEQYKDSLTEAAHWRLVKELKQDQIWLIKTRLKSSIFQFMKVKKKQLDKCGFSEALSEH